VSVAPSAPLAISTLYLPSMFLDLDTHDYNRDIVPFIRNGIILDTSIIKIIIDGLISVRLTKKILKELPEYNNLLRFLEIIKVNNEWDKFLITPHILTEVCTHLRKDYCGRQNYKEVVSEVLPLLTDLKERLVNKDDIVNSIDLKNPIIEIGDISIMLVAESFTNSSEKTAILAKDRGLNKMFEYDKNVLVMDYESVIRNLL